MLPWVEKYRPLHLNEIISHNEITETITKLIDTDKLPHMIFSGPAGVGKTSTILACARKIYGENMKMMILELNGSDNRGIDVIRDQIKGFAASKHMFIKGIKLVILDEADSMTYDAQFALRRVIENYTYNTRFCLICNYASKIIPALQSRCMIFRFAPIDDKLIRYQIADVVINEGVDITKKGTDAIVKLCRGDMRQMYNLLQAVHMSYKKVNEKNVYTCVGNPLPKDIMNILESLLTDTYNEAYSKISELKLEKGLALVDIIGEVTDLLIEYDLTDAKLAKILEHLANIEYRLSDSTSDTIQLAAFVGAFIKVRNM